MDNQEINLRIAEIKDEKSSLIPKILLEQSCNRIKDYITDPALILELELELMGKEWIPVKYGNIYAWENLWENLSDEWEQVTIRNKDFGKATALAWMEEFGK